MTDKILDDINIIDSTGPEDINVIVDPREQILNSNNMAIYHYEESGKHEGPVTAYYGTNTKDGEKRIYATMLGANNEILFKGSEPLKYDDERDIRSLLRDENVFVGDWIKETGTLVTDIGPLALEIDRLKDTLSSEKDS